MVISTVVSDLFLLACILYSKYLLVNGFSSPLGFYLIGLSIIGVAVVLSIFKWSGFEKLSELHKKFSLLSAQLGFTSMAISHLLKYQVICQTSAVVAFVILVATTVYFSFFRPSQLARKIFGLLGLLIMGIIPVFKGELLTLTMAANMSSILVIAVSGLLLRSEEKLFGFPKIDYLHYLLGVALIILTRATLMITV